MKKTKKFAFLSLFSLLLTGCNSTGSASTGPSTGKQPSEAITEPREAPTVAPTEKPTESSTTAGGNSDTSGTESGSTGGTSTSTATQTLWKKSVASRMEKYFDGYIIPYVNIGNYDAEWIDNTLKSSTYLSILGSEFDASKIRPPILMTDGRRLRWLPPIGFLKRAPSKSKSPRIPMVIS
ncbi:MAG: hypothetical protein SOX24_02710 [Candidatus Enterosoma sp.]|nr:hypothetical protein [Candidatus Enterosoma sp.]